MIATTPDPLVTKLEEHMITIRKSHFSSFFCCMFLTIWLLFFSGCPSYTLQRARISGPIKRTPAKLTANKKPGDLHLTPYVSLSPDNSLKATSTNNEADPDFNWKLPTLDLGLDLESTFSRHFLGNIGLNYSSVSGKNLLGGQVGLGYYWNNRTWGWRLDGVVFVQQKHFDIEGLRREYGTSDRIITDQGTSIFVNSAASLTVNSSVPDWPVNFLVTFEVGNNTVYKFDIPPDDAVPYTTTFSKLALGLYKDIGPRTRIVTGLRSTFDHNLEEAEMKIGSSKELFVQLDWKLKYVR